MADLDTLLADRNLGADLPLKVARNAIRQCRLATYSHSFEAFGQNRIVSGAGFVNIAEPRGSHFWLQAMMGPRFIAPRMTTGKHGGKSTTFMADDAQLLPFVAECKANKINTVLFFGIVNDSISTLADTDRLIANITKISKAITDAGILFIITDDLPAGPGSGTNYTRDASKLAGLNRYQRWAMFDLPNQNPLVLAVPVYNRFVARNGTTGVPADNSLFDAADLMHPNVKGHARYALEIYKVLDKLFSQRVNLSNIDNASVYNATLNKRGSLIGNGMMDGDNGSGRATNWGSGGPAGGLTAVMSKFADLDGTPVQQVAITGTATGVGDFQFTRTSGTGNFEPGDTHYAEAFILIKKSDAAVGYQNLRGVLVQASCSHASPSANYNGQAGNVIANDPFPTDLDWSQFNEGKGLYFRTPEEVIGAAWPATSAFAQLTIKLTNDAAAATDIVMQVRQADWRKASAASGF
ncbi:SGNH/GDSL hydrolase family protein [Aureimonas sp. AU40]|uniref:SGNH/GDSL hydrolase family protein n=1 Tax=Aureimonas sp. AU40 TaxID=1637747 RepID=UPI000782AA6B|nr:SGNH/GDSL hydrolase family protein [Aureimonas sp. AU40]